MCTKNTRERNLHMRKKHPGRDLRQKGTLGRNYYSHPSGHTLLGCTAAVSGASDRGFVSGKVFRISPPTPLRVGRTICAPAYAFIRVTRRRT